MKVFLSRVALVAITAGLTACATVPDSIVYKPAEVKPQTALNERPANGAIFQASAYRPMFEDRRARLVGDILTISISERTSAGKSSANSGSKSGSVDAGVTKLFGIPATTSDKFGVTASSDNSFEEKGSTSSSNTFSGNLTVTVVEVLPNGNLLVSGEKQIALDKGVEYVRLSGIVNPNNITGANVVSSTQVADARIEYRTNTRIDKAEVMSQLARFFLSVMPL